MISLEGKRDLFYLIDKIIQSNEFWKINYYLRSMKKAPHGGVMHVFHPRECFKTIKVTKPKYRQVKQRHENRQPSFHTG